MTITLVAILCHALNGIPLCEEVEIARPADENFAGKISDPIPLGPMTPQQCVLASQSGLAAYLREHPGYWVEHVGCPIDYVPKRRA